MFARDFDLSFNGFHSTLACRVVWRQVTRCGVVFVLRRRVPKSVSANDAAVQMIDTSVVRVHQHGACVADNNHQDMGRSRGGLTSIHAVVDTNGLPVHLALTPGEAHDNRLC